MHYFGITGQGMNENTKGKKMCDLPVKQVEEITGATALSWGYSKWVTGTIDDLNKLVEIGAADLEDCQNNSPTIETFLRELEPIKDRVKLIGYIIWPPRLDARVSIEGFTAANLTADEALDLFGKFSADEQTQQKSGSTYSVSFWWD
jgi:hypothetical protein